MLNNAGDEKIHELKFPGGTGRAAAVSPHRAPQAPRGKGPYTRKAIVNGAYLFNDLACNGSNLDLSLLVHRFALAL
jgi:hypothetical protein